MRKLLYLLPLLPSLLWADAKVSSLQNDLIPKSTDFMYIVANSTSMKVGVGNLLNAGSTNYLATTTSATFNQTLLQTSSFTAFQSSMTAFYLQSTDAATTYLLLTASSTFQANRSTVAASVLVGNIPTTSFTPNSTSYIQNTATLQSGATVFPQSLYCSSITFVNASGVRQGGVDNTGTVTANGGFISSANNFLATINNTSSANNARIQMLASGTSINRNVADQNPNLIANQLNASSTGDIFNFQFASVSKASVTANGGVVISSEVFSSGCLPIASTNTAIGMLGTIVDGQGSAITSGSTVAVTVPYDCSITSATIVELSGTSGSISVDVKRIAYSSFVDYTSFVSIVGASGNKPSLSSQQTKAITPTSWTSTQLLAGDVLAFVVDSATSVKLVSVTLWTRKN